MVQLNTSILITKVNTTINNARFNVDKLKYDVEINESINRFYRVRVSLSLFVRSRKLQNIEKTPGGGIFKRIDNFGRT